MGKYLIWMIRYSEALRKMLKEYDVEDMSFSELLQVLKLPENIQKYSELANFLDEVDHSNLPLEVQATKLEKNYFKYFLVA